MRWRASSHCVSHNNGLQAQPPAAGDCSTTGSGKPAVDSPCGSWRPGCRRPRSPPSVTPVPKPTPIKLADVEAYWLSRNFSFARPKDGSVGVATILVANPRIENS